MVRSHIEGMRGRSQIEGIEGKITDKGHGKQG